MENKSKYSMYLYLAFLIKSYNIFKKKKKITQRKEIEKYISIRFCSELPGGQSRKGTYYKLCHISL